MNMVNVYAFEDNASSETFVPGERPETEEDESLADGKNLVYDKFWGGRFTKEQLEYLNGMYAQYEEDYV